jgi:hypothetical protein
MQQGVGAKSSGMRFPHPPKKHHYLRSQRSHITMQACRTITLPLHHIHDVLIDTDGG